MKTKRANMAVSEVIGTINLLGIAVGLFTVLYISVLSISPPPSSPPVDIIALIDGDNLILEHHGGEGVDLDTVVNIRCEASSEDFIVRDHLNDTIDNDCWDIGEKIVYKSSVITDDSPVYVSVIDRGSNHLIMYGVLQENLAR